MIIFYKKNNINNKLNNNFIIESKKMNHNNEDYMGEINDNENSDDVGINMDNLTTGKKQMPVKLNIRKQEVNKIK